MGLTIINPELFNERNLKEEGIWLHRYFPSHYLGGMFEPKSIKLRFSRLDTFHDNLEGWDLTRVDYKVAMDHLADYHSYVINEGGKFGSLSQTLKQLFALSGIEVKDMVKLIEDFKMFDDFRKKHFASCWFVTSDFESESRYMWELYANKPVKESNEVKAQGSNGVMISIKWSDLKAKLENNENNFLTGLVSYGAHGRCANKLFIKDDSYSHEQEFRIGLEKNEIEDKYLFVVFDDLPCSLTVWNSSNSTALPKMLKDLEFRNKSEEENDNKRVWKYSKLLPEIPQVDWSKLIQDLKKEY